MTGPVPADGRSSEAASAPLVREVEIVNKKGLHARASAKFVQTAETFSADIRVTRGQETVGGTSIMGLMMLAAGPGSRITIAASGPDAHAALEALSQLVSSGFGEED
jgi:phosphocarrier protein